MDQYQIADRLHILTHASLHNVIRFAAVAVASWFLWSCLIAPIILNPLKSIPKVKTDWRTVLYRYLYHDPNPYDLLSWISCTPNDGVVRYISIFGQQRLILTSEDTVRQLWQKEQYTTLQKPARLRDQLGRLIGRGLIWAQGEEHKVQKRKLLPAFTHRTVESLYPTYFAKAMELASLLEAEVAVTPKSSSASVDLSGWTSRLSLDIIGVAAWGRDFNALQDPSSDFCKAYMPQFSVVDTQKSIAMKLGLFLPAPIMALLAPSRAKIVRRAVFAAREASWAALKTHNAKLADIDVKTTDDTSETKSGKSGDKTGKSVLATAMASEAFTDEEIIEQLVTLLAAGHETTGTTAIFIFFELARHQEVQDRLRAELRQHFPMLKPAKSTGVNADAVTEAAEILAHGSDGLVYLRAVLNETLRLWPSVPLPTRETFAPTTIGDHFIPAGTPIVFSPLVLNRSKATWGDDAATFRPERWLEEDNNDNSTTSRTSKLATFSFGPRACIGQEFARGELEALVAVLVSRFAFKLDDEAYWREKGSPDLFWGIAVRCAERIGFKLEVLKE